MGIFNADVIINIPLAFFSLQKSGLVRVYLTSVFLLLSVPRCFSDPKPQFDCWPITLPSAAGSGVSRGACPGTEDSPDVVRSGAPSWHSMMALGCSNLDRRSLLATQSLWGS